MYTCERCLKEIKVDDEYEEIAAHFFHTQCYIQGLVNAIATAPDDRWMEVRNHIKNKYDKDSK